MLRRPGSQGLKGGLWMAAEGSAGRFEKQALANSNLMFGLPVDACMENLCPLT